MLAVRILKSMGRLSQDFVISANNINDLDGGGIYKASGERKSTQEMSESIQKSRNEISWEQIKENLIWLECEQNLNVARQLDAVNNAQISSSSLMNVMLRDGYGWRWVSKSVSPRLAHLNNRVRYMVPVFVVQKLARKLKTRTETVKEMIARFKRDIPECMFSNHYKAPQAANGFTHDNVTMKCIIFTPEDDDDTDNSGEI